MPPPFSPRPQFRFRDDGHLFASTGEAFVVDEFDAAGTHLARFGFDLPSRAPTAAELDAERQRMVRFIPDVAMREAMLERMRSPATQHPAITALVALPDRTVWIRESPSAVSDSVQWVIFRGPREPLGRVILGGEESVITSRDGRILIAREDAAAGVTMLRWVRRSMP
jgi:hypothetical protein